MQRSSRPIIATCALAFVTGAMHAAAMPSPPPGSTRTDADVRARPPLPAEQDTTRPTFTAADVRFMQGMIAHHAQALVMAALVPSHTDREAMRLLAQRIEISQHDEIALMQHWLADRHQSVPDPAVAHAGHDTTGHPMRMPMDMPGMDMSGGTGMPGTRMPGMLTAAQLAELSRATGTAFDRLFLQDMIGHHEGALVMVSDLLATNGAAQAPEVFQFASDVDADQRAEILRMRALLASLPSAPGHR